MTAGSTAAGSIATGGGNGTLCGTGTSATFMGSSGGSVISNIGIADGRDDDCGDRAAATTAGCASKSARAASRGNGSTVPAGARCAGAGGVIGGGAVRSGALHAKGEDARTAAATDRRTVHFIGIALP
ncbi:MAG: hypothetical protein ACKOEL_08325 [Planctomycetota bacterium]